MGLWTWLKNLFGGAQASRRPRREKKKEKEKPLISLVLLLREPRYLDSVMLTSLVNRAWGTNLGTGDPEATEFVVGDSPLFMIHCAERMFLVNNFARPYVDDVEAAARDIPELRLRKAFGGHRAWLSVDLLGEPDNPGDLRPVYRQIGKLTAVLADTDCLALYSPATQQMIPYDAELEEKLRGENALEVFSSLGQVPVMEVKGDDPRMEAAVREARARWPDFVAAFERRRPGQNFGVKAPFVDGEHTEFMWVSVTAVEGDSILGRLDNDPVDVRTVRHGSRVRVKVSELNDWIYTEGDEMRGGFTIKAIQRIQREG